MYNYKFKYRILQKAPPLKRRPLISTAPKIAILKWAPPSNNRRTKCGAY